MPNIPLMMTLTNSELRDIKAEARRLEHPQSAPV
jgi:hypothetical protein